MRHFGKRLFGLFLAACMTLSLLPSTVYAAVGGLLSNSPAENQALLEQLGALTGYDAEAAQALLEQYGVERCYYGHLHGGSHRLAVEGRQGGVAYYLVSADYVGFRPQKICE